MRARCWFNSHQAMAITAKSSASARIAGTMTVINEVTSATITQRELYHITLTL